MESYNWMLIFRPVLYPLQLAGLWPKKESYGYDTYTLHALICIPLFMFAYTFSQIMALLKGGKNLEDLAALFMVTAYVMELTKISIFLGNIKLFKRLIKEFENPILQPKSINQLKITQVSTKSWLIFYRMYVIVGVGSCVFYMVKPIVLQNHDLPVFAWYPFDITKSPYYQITYLYQIIATYYMGMAAVGVDILSTAIMVYVGIQCDLLCDSLKGSKNLRELISCIKHHKKILKFVTELSGFFGNTLLIQFSTSTVVIAFSLFKITLTSPKNAEFYQLVIFCAAMSWELFLFCWFGNEVQIKSGKIGSATFGSRWIGASLEFQNIAIIVMQRTQNEITISVFNLFPLTLQTFMKIIRSAWSYLAVLRQLNDSEI